MKLLLFLLLTCLQIFVLFVSSSAPDHVSIKRRTPDRLPSNPPLHKRWTRADKGARNFNYQSANRTGGGAAVEMYSKQNAKIVLECAVNINFTTSIWLKDGQLVQTILMDNTDNKRVVGHRFLVDAGGNLFIENVRLEDDGRWQCEAEDPFGYVVTGRPIQLLVLEPPKKAYLMIDNRILDPGNPFIPVKENAELTVSCVVDDGNPKPTLSWELRLGNLALLDVPEVPLDVLNITETVHEQAVGVRNDASLGKVLRTHHNATLTCFVHHIALQQALNVSVLLNVEYTPSFAISREPGFGIPIREGIAVSLKCDVDANPRALPMWMKDDVTPPVQQSPDGFLNFSRIEKQHSGWYKCMTRHQMGRFSSIGYFLNVRPDIDVTPEPEFDFGELSSTGRQIEVSLGGAVHLECPPGTSGCWTRVESGSNNLQPMGASQELRLDQVLYQEAGDYRCLAPIRETTRKLDEIRNSMSFNVVVKGRPIVTPTQKNVTAVYGQPLTLTMEFCANPSFNKIFWVAGKKLYEPGDADTDILAYGITNLTDPHCHQAVLFLTKVSNKHIGEYIFLVRSSSGLAEGTFFVNMTYASGESVKNPTNNTSSVFAKNTLDIFMLFLICYYYY